MEHVLARRVSLKQCGQYREESTQGEKQSKTGSRGREAGTGAREISPTLSVLEKNTHHIKDRHRHGLLCHVAREKAEFKRWLKTKSIISASTGIRIRQRGAAVTAS